MILKFQVKNIMEFNPDIELKDIVKAVKKWDEIVVQTNMGYFGYYDKLVELNGVTTINEHIGRIENVIYDDDEIKMSVKLRSDYSDDMLKDRKLGGFFTLLKGKLYLQGVGILIGE